MSTQREDVQINLKIQGIEEFRTLKDLNSQIIADRNALNRMDRNSLGYGEAADRLRQLITLQGEWRTQIYGTRRAAEEANKEIKSNWDSIMDTAIGTGLGNLLIDGFQSALGAVTNFFTGAEEGFHEAELGQAQLSAALTSTGQVAGKTVDQLNDLAGTLMDLTGIDDDVITKSESLLLTFTNIRGEIYDQTLPAIVDMTAALNGGNVSMETIQATTMQVGKALNDPIKGMTALRKVGVSFSEDQVKVVKALVDANDAAGAQKLILAELAKEFGGMAESMAKTDTGQLIKTQTRLGNIQEALGGLITESKASMSQVFAPLVTWLERVTATKMSDTLEKDRAALAANLVQLQASNTSHETRVGIIKKLKEQYPAYLSQIDAEKTSNSQLLPILNEINTALVMKIAFTKKNEALNRALEDEADLFLKQDKAATQLSQTIATIMERARDKGLNIVLPKNLTDLEQADFLIQKLNASKRDGTGLNVNLSVQDLKVAQANLMQLRRGYQDAGEESAKLLEAQNAFAKKYKLNEKGETKTMAENNKAPVVAPPVVASTKEADAKHKHDVEEAKKIDKELTEEMKALGIERVTNLLAEHQKEEALLEQKYQKLIDKEKEFAKLKGTTAEQRKKHEEEASKLEEEKTLAVADLRAKTEAKMQDEITQLRSSLGKDLATELDNEKEQINRFYDQQIKANAGNQERINSLQKEKAKDLADAEIREAERLKEEKKRITESGEGLLEDNFNNRILAIRNQYDLEIEELKKKFSAEEQLTQEFQDTVAAINANRSAATKAEERKNNQEKLDYGIQGAEILTSTISTISANNRRRETDIVMRNLDKQREKELSNKNLTEEQKKAINDKFDEKVRQEKLRAWKAEQNAAAKQALIGGLLGAAKALPNFIAAGLAMAAGVANAVAIKAEKPPVFSKGGLIPQGASHAQGGISLTDNATGQEIGEMEGGEPIMILSKETARNNRALINELLFNSQFRNGAPVSVNAELASQVMRPFANGGILQTTSQSSEAAALAPVANLDTSTLERKMGEKFDQLLEAWKGGIPFDYRNDVEYRAKIARIENSVKG